MTALYSSHRANPAAVSTPNLAANFAPFSRLLGLEEYGHSSPPPAPPFPFSPPCFPVSFLNTCNEESRNGRRTFFFLCHLAVACRDPDSCGRYYCRHFKAPLVCAIRVINHIGSAMQCNEGKRTRYSSPEKSGGTQRTMLFSQPCVAVMEGGERWLFAECSRVHSFYTETRTNFEFLRPAKTGK